MDKKTLALIISGNLLTLVVAFGLMLLFFQREKNDSSKTQVFSTTPNQNSFSPPGSIAPTPVSNGPVIVEKEEEIPAIVNGVVMEMSDDIVIKQYADFDFRMKIKKRDIKEVLALQKNPKFDEAKLKEAIETTMGKMEKKNSNENGDPGQSLPKIPQGEVRELQKNPQFLPYLPYLEEDSSWSEVKVGSQVMIRKEKDGGKTLVIYPKDFPIDYSGSPSKVQEEMKKKSQQ